MKSLITTVTGFLLIVAQSVFGSLIGNEYLVPNLLLAFVLFMGAIDFGSARGAAICFVLGYLLDVYSGSTTGIHTFVVPATYLLFRAVYARMMLSGIVFQVFLTFLSSLAAGGLVVVLRSLFERSIFALEVIPLMLFANSAATALVSPLVFRLGKALILESPTKKEGRLDL